MLAPLYVVLQAAASDPVPDDNDVTAGWVGALVFVLLIVAVVILLRSFTKQLKKVDKAEEAGVYDEHAPEQSAEAPQSAQQSTQQSGQSPDLPPTTDS
jgi:flagellar biosynthesis/type III secretory pathway M-ring protein FliF/YscJ